MSDTRRNAAPLAVGPDRRSLMAGLGAIAADGFQTYDKLTDADRKVLAGSVNTLAEDLATLRGKLGLG